MKNMSFSTALMLAAVLTIAVAPIAAKSKTAPHFATRFR